MSAIDSIIVGLGNPGKEYEKTRHNVGFLALDFLAKHFNCDFNLKKFNSKVGSCQISGKKVLFLKPQTYMNLSGEAVVSAMNFYKIPPEKVLLIFDDVSFEVGKIRIKKKGSHGGQNGVKNIIALSGSDMFPRVKIGVGNKPNPGWDLADWVLSKFSASDFKTLEESFEKVVSIAELIVSGQIENAMSNYN